MPSLRLAAAVLLAAVGLNTLAAEAEKPRPKVALVLSGGGARGLSHIGVLKVLREARVPIDFIVATSMGSIVGGSYAAGNTPERMEELVNSADWDQIFSDRAPREFLSFRRKADDLRLIGKSELGVKDGTVVLPRGAFGSQNLEEFLRQVSHPASDARTLNDLPILFRAVATDLESGAQVVLENVPLPVAMRASMSIPGAFAPQQVDGRLLGDGGLVRNLPVEVAREMGADVIIAVNVGTPLLPRKALSSALGVAQQMINILTEQNVAISLAALRPNDILISPDLNDVTFVDFERGPDLITRGEAAARAVYERLAALGWEPARYAAWEKVRTRAPESFQIPIRKIIVEGAHRTNTEAILNEVASRADLVAGSVVTDDQLLKAARILHGWGEFERVDVRAQFDGGFRNVVIDVDEKPWGPNYLRFGGSITSDFQTNASVQLNIQHTRTWVNSWGAEWRNEFGLGETRRYATSFYQPLGPGSPWFVEPIAEFLRTSGDLFDDAYHRTDRIEISQQTYAMSAGLRLGNIGVARFGAGYQRYKLRSIIGTTLNNSTLQDSAKVALGDITLDTLDDPNFPRRGYLFEATGTRAYYKEDEGGPLQTYRIGGMAPLTFGRLTLLGVANVARSRDDRGGFSLGGLFNLSGTPAGALTGSQTGVMAGLAYYKLPGELLPKALGRNFYAGFSLEAGNAWQSKSDIHYSDLKKAASLFVGFDTILGPLYFGWGHTFSGPSAFYLLLGRPSDRLGPESR